MINFKELHEQQLAFIRVFVKATILRVDSIGDSENPLTLGDSEKPIALFRELLLRQLERIAAYELIPFDDFPSELMDTETRSFCVVCELISTELLALAAKISNSIPVE